MNPITSDPLDRNRFPLDEWALVETEFDPGRPGRAETIFAVGNGYLGLRGNLDEGRDGHVYGTFINGFHETWPIRHAEEAFGFARVGQTIVNVPDAKVIRLYVDDEPFVLSRGRHPRATRAASTSATASSSARLEWRTPSGKRVLIRSRRLVSFTDRHLAVIDYEVTMLDADASVLHLEPDPQPPGRQRRVPRGHAGRGDGFDPRKAESFTERVLQPRLKRINGTPLRARLPDDQLRHDDRRRRRAPLETENEWRGVLADRRRPRQARLPGAGEGRAADPPRQDHQLPHLPRRARRASSPTAATARSTAPARRRSTRASRKQREWLDDFWARTDVEIAGQPAIQQAIRWNLFQLAQATARTDGDGVAAKGVSGSGYGGHYFWDTEIYVLPFLTYTAPIVARNALRFRHEHARRRPRPRAPSSTSAARCSRGARSTGSSRARTTPPAPRSTTSTPTSRMR